MSAHILTFPRAATYRDIATPRGSLYDRAYEATKTATDWPTKLALAETLSHSPDWTHTALARHIRTAHSLYLAGLLKPVDPRHRDGSDLIDGWRADALEVEAAETAVQIALRYRPQLVAVALGLAGAAVVAAGFAGWVL